MKKQNSFLGRALRYLLYVLPAVLFFSYYPVIKFGESEAMFFELSLPLIWLVVFFGVSVVQMIRRRKLLNIFRVKHGWLWLMLPVWLSITAIWSANSLRGLLTAGIFWLVFFAGYAIWNMREQYDERFKLTFLKWLFGSTLVVCGWCVLQCVLDLVGVAREHSLLCEGCTYQMFGFPHPNGFAIEPQFMGNLLLAPAMMSVWLLYRQKLGEKKYLDSKFLWVCLFAVASVLFLTFSRGAIYAFLTGLLFMTGFDVARAKKKEREIVAKRMGLIWGVVVMSFVFVLNMQGAMSALGPTVDTYGSGVAKVINHLSLGVIDVRGEKESVGDNDEVVENYVEKSVEKSVENIAKYDGYVAVSTDIRVEMSRIALDTWASEPRFVLFGVGLGGAGQALYDRGMTGSPREIVQNQFISLLFETGAVGVGLFVAMGIVFIRMILKGGEGGLVLSVVTCYLVSLCFFAGLPNALQIYLMPVVLAIVFGDRRLKLRSRDVSMLVLDKVNKGNN